MSTAPAPSATASCRPKYNSGITLFFLLFRNHDLFIGVSAPDWSLDPHSPYTMTLVIDGKTIRSAPGTVLRYDTKRLWLDLGKGRKIRELLRWGLKLRLHAGRARLRIPAHGDGGGAETPREMRPGG